MSHTLRMRPGVSSFFAVEHFSVFLLILFIGLCADKFIDKGLYTLFLMHLSCGIFQVTGAWLNIFATTE